MPEPKDLHTDAVLAGISVQYRNKSFVADEVLPIIPVKKKSDKFPIYNKPDRFNIQDTLLAPKAEANEVDWGISQDTYSCQDHALREFVSRAEIENADAPITPMVDTTELLTDLLLLAREKRVADLLVGPGTPLSSTTLSGTDQWNDHDNSDPIQDIRDAKSNMFVDPNLIVIPRLVYDKLVDHPDIVNRIKLSANKVVTPQLLAELFEVDRVIVAASRYNTANLGQTPSYDYVWGKHVLLAFVTPRPGIKKVTLGYTFRWNLPGSRNGWSVRRWDEPKRGIQGGVMIQVEHSDDEKVVCSDAGYVIKNAVA